VAKREEIEEEELVEEDVIDEEPEPEDEVERLNGELEEARAQAAEYLDGWQRAQAEFANYRKRQEGERTQMVAQVSAGMLRKLLPIVDDFERAVATLPSESGQSAWSDGVLLIKHKLDALLESEGVTPIEAEGQPFDPRYHEAVTYEDAPGYDDGQVIGETQKGYLLGERVLRPALVRVARQPSAPVEEDDEMSQEPQGDANDSRSEA
jgi:molecular chaperone GrpE